MKIGTADIIEDPLAPTRTKRGSVGGPSKGGGGDGGKGPHGDGPDGNSGSPLPYGGARDKSRILTAFLLLVVLMTFGGLISAYIVIATNNVAEWRPFDLPVQVWISTVIILASSVTYHFGKIAVDRNDQPGAKRWFVVTTVLGAAFISSQVLAWLALVSRGLYMQGNPYVGFFYILTAVHAAHVIGGVSALGLILLRSLTPSTNEAVLLRRRALAQTVGWYWHFMGILWLVLFVLLGFWK